jgi:uncharacterized protein YjbI with pentapeptide repeats
VTDDMRSRELGPLRLLRWWAAALGALAVVVSTAATTLWLLSIAARSPSLRLEAIKIGLSVGAGTGAAFALMLAFRRQWLSERGQRHLEDVARTNVYDATQRRITELYGRAVEQLGHEKAAVRLGGLYSLERLAQEEPEHRQTVVEVVCAYLRMPFQPPSLTGSKPSLGDLEQASGSRENVIEGNASKEEFQVRLAAQRLLARHLEVPVSDGGEDRSANSPVSYWPGIRIDLFGALLVDLDFSRCNLFNVDFRRARFIGNAAFQGAHFQGTVSFLGAEFEGEAWFQGSDFSTHAGFYKAKFSHDAWFQKARFYASASFREARFQKIAGFGDAEFSGNATFDGACFKGDAGFRDVWFGGRSGFRHAHFWQAAVFRGVKFDGDARFDLAEFDGDARFNLARWMHMADFAGAIFKRRAGFQGSQFVGTSRFDGAQLELAPKFGRASASSTSQHTWPVGWRMRQPSDAAAIMGQVVHDPGAMNSIVPRQASRTESSGGAVKRSHNFAEEESSGMGSQ